MDILIDFDGTCVLHEFPKVGPSVPGAVETLKAIVANGHNLILFTMRSDVEDPKSESEEIVCQPGPYLTEAVQWFVDNEIPLYGIQVNPTQHTWTTSPKAYGQLMIDDSALGCPLIPDPNARPFVDWIGVRKLLKLRGVL
ncbi:MAG: hypothetical protein H7282_04935 [Cytophagaceae bacterium]|nr:hypothetical protein [Cytophagaceae bacterium]